MSLLEPLSNKRLILIPLCVFWLMFPLVAQEAGEEARCCNCEWNSGYIEMPAMVETVKAEEPEPQVLPVASGGHGNGTCVPYARARTGIEIYGWAGSFLEQAPLAGYTVTEIPQIGSIVVTSEGGGHVAVVEDILGNDILVSEQNYSGLHQVTRRKINIESPIIMGYIY